MSKYDAVDTTLGFAYQILSALVLLLDAEDDEAVTIELSDDVTIHHTPNGQVKGLESRYQVSHTLKGAPAELSLKSVKLWKTLAIWASEFSRRERYLLLTCVPLSQELRPLAGGSGRTALQSLFVDEASRVLQETDAKTHKHADRLPGCRAFLKLSGANQIALLERITVLESSPNILQIDGILDRLFRNTVRTDKRPLLIGRLREYWFNRVFKSLTFELPRIISKSEVQDFIEQMVWALCGTALPDNFGDLAPPTDLTIPDIMRRQIEIVNGGRSRITRAKVAHWRSRNQRDRWMADDIAFRNSLDLFDRKLIEHWDNRHGPICDDTEDATEEQRQKAGCNLLDWSHNEAPAALLNVGMRIAPVFLVQGTYQDLADRLSIGWHPKYKDLLEGAKVSAPDKS